MHEVIRRIQRSLAELEEVSEKQKEISNRLGDEISELNNMVYTQFKNTARLLLLHFIKALEKENNSIRKYAYGDGTDNIYNIEDTLELLEGVLDLAEKGGEEKDA